VLKLGTESLERVIDALGLCLCKVSVGLNFALDVLELCFELLFTLDALHKHDVIVTVHFDKLVVHILERLVVILLIFVRQHVLLSQLALWIGDLLAVLLETDAIWLHS